jgi:hypothetical protein
MLHGQIECISCCSSRFCCSASSDCIESLQCILRSKNFAGSCCYDPIFSLEDNARWPKSKENMPRFLHVHEIADLKKCHLRKYSPACSRIQRNQSPMIQVPFEAPQSDVIPQFLKSVRIFSGPCKWRSLYFPFKFPNIQKLHRLIFDESSGWGALRIFRRRNSSTTRCLLWHIELSMCTEKMIAVFWRETRLFSWSKDGSTLWTKYFWSYFCHLRRESKANNCRVVRNTIIITVWSNSRSGPWNHFLTPACKHWLGFNQVTDPWLVIGYNSSELQLGILMQQRN